MILPVSRRGRSSGSEACPRRQCVRQGAAMLENVPQRLTDYLRGAASDFDRESFYYFAVAYVGLFYLGKNFTKPETSDFLDIQRTNRGGIWYGHVGRVLLIGETLFLMRSSPGFTEFCRRMRGRDLRSTYFEMYAARMFLEGGYEVIPGVRMIDSPAIPASSCRRRPASTTFLAATKANRGFPPSRM